MVAIEQIDSEIPTEDKRVNETANQIVINIPRLDDNVRVNSLVPAKALPFYNNLMKYNRSRQISSTDSSATKLFVTFLRAVDYFTIGELNEVAQKVSAYAVDITNEKIEQDAGKITEFKEFSTTSSGEEVPTKSAGWFPSLFGNKISYSWLTTVIIITVIYLLICVIVTTRLLVKKIYR